MTIIKYDYLGEIRTVKIVDKDFAELYIKERESSPCHKILEVKEVVE